MKSIMVFLNQSKCTFLLLSLFYNIMVFADNKCVESYDSKNNLHKEIELDGTLIRPNVSDQGLFYTGAILERFQRDRLNGRYKEKLLIKINDAKGELEIIKDGIEDAQKRLEIITRRGQKFYDINGYLRAVQPAIDNRSHLKVLGMDRTIEEIPKESPILLLGEGTTGTLLASLKEKSFSNLRSIDIEYGMTLPYNGLSYSIKEHGDAADLKKVASSSQKLVLSKDLLASAPKTKIFPILTETIRVLAPLGEARHSFVGNELKEILLNAKTILSYNDITIEIVITDSKTNEGYIKITKSEVEFGNKQFFNTGGPRPPAIPPLMLSPEILTFGAKGIVLSKKHQRVQVDALQEKYSKNYLISTLEDNWEKLFLTIMKKLNPNALGNNGKLDEWRNYFNQNVRVNFENGNFLKALAHLRSFDTKAFSVLLRKYQVSDEKGNMSVFYYYGNSSEKLNGFDYNDLFPNQSKIKNVNKE